MMGDALGLSIFDFTCAEHTTHLQNTSAFTKLEYYNNNTVYTDGEQQTSLGAKWNYTLKYSLKRVDGKYYGQLEKMKPFHEHSPGYPNITRPLCDYDNQGCPGLSFFSCTF